jgi:hypothetical protein
MVPYEKDIIEGNVENRFIKNGSSRGPGQIPVPPGK